MSKANPGRRKWGGGSASGTDQILVGLLAKAAGADPGLFPGGPDHLAPMLSAEAIGVAPKAVTYVQYDGGGKLLAAILGKRVSFGVSGVGEIADQISSGQLRVLAVTSGSPVPGLAALGSYGSSDEEPNAKSREAVDGPLGEPGLFRRLAGALGRSRGGDRRCVPYGLVMFGYDEGCGDQVPDQHAGCYALAGGFGFKSLGQHSGEADRVDHGYLRRRPINNGPGPAWSC